VDRFNLVVWLLLLTLTIGLGWVSQLSLPAVLAALAVVSVLHLVSQWVMARGELQ
jgi:hypothetical protein